MRAWRGAACAVLLAALPAIAGCSGMPDMEAARRAEQRQDHAAAVRHYRELAERGFPGAQVALGRHYLSGKGVGADPRRALELFAQAREARADPRLEKQILAAQVRTGVLALQGKVPGVTPALGARMLEEAGRAGDSRALFELGLAHEKGIGVARNIPAALNYYARSGAAGYGRADYVRAAIYEKGKLAPRNLALAVDLYRSAISKGYAKGKEGLIQAYEKQATGRPLQIARTEKFHAD